jgi:membrane protein
MSNKWLQPLSTFFSLLRKALQELVKNDPLRMAGATAFFTTFALPPLLIILFQLLRLFVAPEILRTELSNSLGELVGPETVDQITSILRSILQLAYNGWITAGGFLFLLFVATTLFKVIKSSINQLWRVRPLPHKGMVQALRTRGQSLLIIAFAALLFVVGLMLEGIRVFVGSRLSAISPLLSAYLSSVLNHVVGPLVVMLWLTLVFRYLPDARPHWRVALVGAALTAALFTLGKLVLHWLLSYSKLNTVYGTSASLVLLLLFVFYASLILYYGAAFTRVWGKHVGDPILARPYAAHYRVIEAPDEPEISA